MDTFKHNCQQLILDCKSARNKVNYKYIFIAAFLIGLFAQGSGIFNKFCVHDDADSTFAMGNTYVLGRWMLGVITKIESFIFSDGWYSSPVYNGMITLLCLAIVACLIVALLEIDSKIYSICVVGVLVSFPLITGLFSYMFTSHYYILGLLIGTLGTFLICRYNSWLFYIMGIFGITMSMGVYQALLPFYLTLMVMHLIKVLMGDEEFQPLDGVKRALYYAGGAVLSLIFYLIINKIFLKLINAQMLSYKGVNTMGMTSIGGYISRAAIAYKHALLPSNTVNFDIYYGAVRYVYISMIVFSLILDIILCMRLHKENVLKMAFYMLFVALLPLCYNFIYVMTGVDEVHSLMVYAQVLPFVRFAWLAEKVSLPQKKLQECKLALSQLMLVFLIVAYARYDNKCYLKAAFVQQEAISYFTTMVTQIKSTPGYDDEYEVVYINEGEITDQTLYYMEQLSDIKTAFYYDIDSYLNSYAWRNFVQKWCGFDPTVGDASYFQSLPEVEAMPSYPDDGSIQIIDSTVVVKF